MDTLQKKKGLTAIWISIMIFMVSLHWLSFCFFSLAMAFFAHLEFKEQKDKTLMPWLLPSSLIILILISGLIEVWYITVIIFTVMLTDVFSNIVGKCWKSICKKAAQFAPEISPKKTWAGAIGGLITGAITFPVILNLIQLWQQPEMTNANIFLTPTPLTNPLTYSLGTAIAWLAAMGDLSFSQKKRQWNIKDYYFSLDRGYQVYIFGAHGGVCDRLDSWTFVSLLFGFLLLGDLLITGFSNEVIKVLPLMVLIHADTYRVKQIQNADPLDIGEKSDGE